jgi:hypothetical protein
MLLQQPVQAGPARQSTRAISQCAIDIDPRFARRSLDWSR